MRWATKKLKNKLTKLLFKNGFDCAFDDIALIGEPAKNDALLNFLIKREITDEEKSKCNSFWGLI